MCYTYKQIDSGINLICTEEIQNLFLPNQVPFEENIQNNPIDGKCSVFYTKTNISPIGDITLYGIKSV